MSSSHDRAADNKLVDQLLAIVVAKYGAQLDPLHLNDTVATYDRQLSHITVHAGEREARLSEGIITGLKTLRRSGDSTLDIEQGQINLQFGDTGLHVQYKCDLDVMGIKTSGILGADVGDIGVVVNVEADSTGRFHIKDFTVDELTDVRVDFKGSIEQLDEVIDVFGDVFIEIFNPVARGLISWILRDLVDKELRNITIPIDN
ncbi:unnamed protein product [Oppiella nova]|uniref:Uncharacterized protein n=1 Tax=Oppiella nova TaxID=334625 RepID=A0A7R9M9U7_9ACAR|nr:unnamed protein product [Oppiella nova]CAG2173434.1 unnamed protein product [Oppiella nova]